MGRQRRSAGRHERAINPMRSEGLTLKQEQQMQDLIPLAEKIADVLKTRRQTIAVAESSSGGLISSALLAIPGASAYYLGGAVVYTLQSRRSLLDLPDSAF